MARARPEPVDVVELPSGRVSERAGLREYLAAHLALERATARRVLLAHLTAVAGIPVWTCLLVPVSHGWRALSVWAFAGALSALAAAFMSEASHRATVRDAERPPAFERNDTE